ncbi:MAG: hypothetical protein KC733_08880 [Candidatus Omnitrophica bacterium]|nr:hypothetical protein [Candidatus Omnitrophota bacterium]
MEQQKGWKGYYILTLLMMFLAAFMRLSIVIIPALILGHILLIRKEEHILKKLTLWLPGIFLIVAGQLYFTLMIKLQFTLHKLTTPVKHLFHNYSPGWAFLFSLVFISIIWLSTYIAIKIKIYRFIKKGFEFLVLGWFLAPQYIGLCLYLWLRPVIPDSEINPFMRLQLMSFPSGLPGLILLCAVTSALMLIFSIYARKHNKPLMLFILWSMILFFFFDFSPKDTPSRYLIYAMPTTACLISCLLFEILPQWIPSLKLRFYRAILFTCIMIIAVFNILGIHQRLAQTILSNIIWSYDYAKTANLIADDLKKNGGEGLTDVCVRNVQPIPYLKNFGFLDNYDFHSEDAFAITMRSRWPQANVRWYINQPCPANALIYQNTDTTVVDQSGRNLEKENPLPFAFQLFLDMDHRFWLTRAQKLARAQAMIKASIQPFPGEDAKMLWIKRMLEQELRVYEKTKNRDH